MVGIGNLRVVLVKEGDVWSAQGLEIDHVAQGVSLDDAKKNFQESLRATVALHLNLYGNISGLLRVAPSEVWAKYLFKPGSIGKVLTQLTEFSIENVPDYVFSNIAYLEPNLELSAAGA